MVPVQRRSVVARTDAVFDSAVVRIDAVVGNVVAESVVVDSDFVVRIEMDRSGDILQALVDSLESLVGSMHDVQVLEDIEVILVLVVHLDL